MPMMTSRERLLAALERRQPDRLPVTTHHVMPYFLNKYLDGRPYQEFFDHFGMDPILWTGTYKPREGTGDYYDPAQGTPPPAEYQRIVSDQWRVESEDVPGQEYATTRFRIVTPKGTLSTTLQSNEYTTWVTERLIKEPKDIDLLQYMTSPGCDVEAANRMADEFGDRGLVRCFIPGFEIYGQPGCWQDAACLFGIQNLIMATFSDPEWVHAFLGLLRRRKLDYIETLRGARYDVLELGGGDASSTVIGPQILEQFVIPYDKPLIDAAHAVGQRIAYHTCGGMMPFLELLAGMGPDAMETLTPVGMGGDARLAEAKRRIGDKVCLIGGFDQFHFFKGCTPEQTRAEVRRCFEEAGPGGGYIISPSDHFFDAEPELVAAYADEARRCFYD